MTANSLMLAIIVSFIGCIALNPTLALSANNDLGIRFQNQNPPGFSNMNKGDDPFNMHDLNPNTIEPAAGVPNTTNTSENAGEIKSENKELKNTTPKQTDSVGVDKK